MTRNTISITMIILCILTSQLKSQCWSKISGGEFHVLAISNDGRLYGWGINENYQLGDGTATNRNLPTLINNEINWQKVSAGLHHSLALKNNGTLWAWGRNNYYQLGDGTNLDKTTPIQIGTDNNWTSISAGTLHSIGLKNDGTLWVWGNSSSGELGLGNIQTAEVPTQINNSTDWRYITTGNSHSIATKLNGTLWAWGQNGINMQIGAGSTQLVTEPFRIISNETWQKIEAGIFHNILLDSNGKIWTIGDNQYGQLGDATFEDKGTLTKIGNESWLTIASGRAHCAAIATNNSLWTWGRNISGQLGSGDDINSNMPINVGIDSKWIEVIAGINYTMGLDDNGELWAVGANDFGQLGIDSFEESINFVKIECPELTDTKNTKIINQTIISYPNPVINSMYLDWESLNANWLKCSVLNLNGSRVIPEIQINKNESINLINLNPGIYFLEMSNDRINIKSKFLKINAM